MNFKSKCVKLLIGAGLILSGITMTYAAFQSQYTIYATLLYHFAKYTQFPSVNPTMVIGVMGKTPLNHEVLALTGKTVGTSQIQVKEIGEVSEIEKCNIVFVPATLSGKFNEVVNKAKENHTLIVSDAPDGCKSGAVINFYEENSKVRFEISNKNAGVLGLKISNDLQKLGKVVD
jgi:hypothetical protein